MQVTRSYKVKANTFRDESKQLFDFYNVNATPLRAYAIKYIEFLCNKNSCSLLINGWIIII